jgi:CDP-diglyceride synthetase
MSLCSAGVIQSFILLLIANGAPLLANNLLPNKWNRPVDNGFKLTDGRPLFGKTKTWRGLFAAVSITMSAAVLMDIKPIVGALFGGLAMVGDLLSSFIKRRLGHEESVQARGFDTIPESLLPVYVLKKSFELSFTDITLIVVLFFLAEEWLSPLLYKLHIRKRPY